MALFTLHRIADKFCRIHHKVADIRAAVRAARAEGMVPQKQAEAVQLVRDAVAAQSALRAKRSDNRRVAETKPVARRLEDYREAKRGVVRVAVREAMSGLYRVAQSRWAGGNHTTTIYIGECRWKSARNDGTAVGAAGESYREWSSNGKWSGNSSKHIIQVRPNWIQAVKDRGLAVCDGMLTLDAEPVAGRGPELFRATWVTQGRGFELHGETGYIARDGNVTYHARTAKGALTGLRRKMGQLPRRAIDLDRLVRRYGSLPVTLADAEGIACASGSRSWCHAVCINPDATVTLAEVIAGYKIRPMPEALSIIRRVVQRHRQWERVLSEPRGNVRFDGEGGFRVEG